MSAAEEPMTLREQLNVVTRRGKAMIAAAAIGLLVTFALALLLPAYYQSTGTILIEQQELPVDLVRSTVTSYADQRVQVISQRVMTTQNLLDIIRRYDLYPRERRRESREVLIEGMRNDIEFKMISADVIDPRSGAPRAATIAFSVAYTSRSSTEAAKVANELVTLYLNENLTERTRLAADASDFLTAEGDRLSADIAELESKLARFKERNADSLPELNSLNLQLLDRTEQELRAAEARQISLEQQRVFLEAQLVQVKPNSALYTETGERVLSTQDRLKMLRSQLAQARARYAGDHPDIARMSREIAGLEAELGVPVSSGNDRMRALDQARAQLAQARDRYSPEHPDIKRLEREVAILEAAPPVQAENAAPKAATPADNPVYVQLNAQLSATVNESRGVAEQMRRLRARVADYQRKIGVSPQIEREYRELSRDHQNAQLKYQEIRSKQMEAQLAQNLESDRKGERFTLIEPPLPPEEPVSPNRPLIMILGLILSAGLAVGAAALLEAIDTTVRGRNDLAKLLNEPPLALVPTIATEGDARAVRRRLRLMAGAAVLAGFAAIAALHFFYRPMDVLWFVAMRRFGL